MAADNVEGRGEAAPPILDAGAGARRLARRLPDYLTWAVALVLWRLFFPALMSKDSITQYGQALSRDYSDWHPPLMSIALSVVLIVGGTVGLLMLFQCLAGVFGIRALASACLAQLFGPRISPQRAAWLSLLVLLLLLLPVTPLAFYLMTLWKDVWALVLLLWGCALSLRMLAAAVPAGGRPPSAREILLLLSLSVAFGMIRHNAVVTLPLFGLVLWASTRRFSRVWAWALAAAPLLLCLALGVLIDRVFQVRKLHPDSQVMALDLLGLCAGDEDLCAELPFLRRHILDPSFRSRYRPGDIGLIFWAEPRVVDLAIVAPEQYPELRAEYLRAAARHPVRLARLKWEAFVQLLGLDETFYFFHYTIVENPYGLTLNTRFQGPREWLIRSLSHTGGQTLRWVSGVHLVWLLANLLWIGALLARFRQSREPAYRSLALVLLIPLAYYLSYVFATPVHDFRFMYPATVVVQCVTLAGAIGAVLQKPAGRAPNSRTLPA